MEITNQMRCDLSKPGGPKFLEIQNILEVLQGEIGPMIAEKVKRRIDDRDALIAAGANRTDFLPAERGVGDREESSEALYYKIVGIKGKSGAERLGNLEHDTRVLVRRERSSKDKDGKEKSPYSFTVIKGKFEDLPGTDFATVIVGREGGKSKDEIWTIHPGLLIQPTERDLIPGSEDLPGPEDGKRQRVIVTTVGELLVSGRMNDSDYIKIIPGDFDAVIKDFDVVQ